MNEVIYLEPDEDITGVIAKVKETASDAISLVIPRGGSIAQSIVNLKLLKREIEKNGKTVSLVTKDKISKNLASQVGVTVYPSISEAKNSRAEYGAIEKRQSDEKPDGFSTTGIKINQYSRENAEDEEDELDEEDEEAEAIEEVTEESDKTQAREEKKAPAQRKEATHDRPERADIEYENEEPQGDEEESFGEELDVEGERVALERNNLAHAKPIPKIREEKPIEEKKEMSKHNVSSRRKPAIIIISILLILIIAAAGVLYPSAQVKITLATTNIEDKSDIIADKAATATNLDTMTLPAKEYSVEKTGEKQVPTTGTKDVGTKASGEITFYNNVTSPSITPITLPSGTMLIAAGKAFVLDGSITIPQATITGFTPPSTIISTPGQIKGKVIAKENGEDYNIAASKFVVNSFTGTKRESVYGQSSAAMTGGVTKSIKIVAKEDIENAKAAISEELSNTAKGELVGKADGDKLKLIASSILSTELESSSDKAVGDEADNVVIKLKSRLTELGYSDEGLRTLVMDRVKKTMKDNEMLVNPTDTDLKFDLARVDTAKGQAFFKSTYSGKLGKKIEASKIQEMLPRTKYGNAVSRIEAIDGVKEAQINVSPDFWPLMPFIKQRIKVNFDYQKE